METPDSNAIVASLQHRLEKLEKEKEELEEKVKKLNLDKNGGFAAEKELHFTADAEKSGNALMEKVLAAVLESRNETKEEIKALHNEVKKIAGDSVMAKYETQAMVVENREELKRGKEELLERFSKITEKTETEIMEIVGLLQRNMEVIGSLTGLQNDIKKIVGESQAAILEKLVPLSVSIKYIEKQVNTETVDIKDNMFILNGNKWVELSLKLPKCFDEGAIYLNGEIYIICGKELYKLHDKSLKWKRLADMQEARVHIRYSCLEWNGCIWVFGGRNKYEHFKSVERYDPKEDKWIKMNDMNHPRSNAAAAVHNSKFIICGGWTTIVKGGPQLKSVECYDPESDIWTELNDLPTPRFGHSLISFEKRLILLGGNDGKGKIHTILELEEEGTWKELSLMKHARDYFPAVILNKEIHVIGGRSTDNTEMRDTEIFDGVQWRDGPLLPDKRSCMAALVIPNLAESLCNYSP